MPDRVRIIGSYLSPYVRKVLVFLDLKGVPYEIDPIIPFFGDDRFAKVSPIRRIPVLIDDAVTLSDSSVICQYLEDRYPAPALYPADVVGRARARWLEEFADTRMGEVLIWRLFNQVAIKPFVWGEKTDNDVVAKTLAEDIPQILDYLEGELPATGLRVRRSVHRRRGDRVLLSQRRLRALHDRRGTLADHRRHWSSASSHSPPFQRLAPFEDKMIRTPIPEQRTVLGAMGAPLTAESYGTRTPRRGVMQI